MLCNIYNKKLIVITEIDVYLFSLENEGESLV